MRAPQGSDARGGGPRWTGSTGRGRSGTPRGADVAPTRWPRGSHVGGQMDCPDLPPGRSDGGGGSRPGAHGHGSNRPSGRGAWRRGATLRRRKAASGGDRPVAEGGDVAATRTATAAAKRLGGGVAAKRRGREGGGEEGPHRQRLTTASDGGRWRRRDKLRNHLANTKKGVREREEDGRGRGSRPKVAAMVELTGVRGGGEADGVALGLANPTAATARPGVAASGYRSGGGEADGVALGLANPTAATARPGVAASGYRSGGGGEEGDGARAIEGTGELGEMGKKGQGIAGMRRREREREGVGAGDAGARAGGADVARGKRARAVARWRLRTAGGQKWETGPTSGPHLSATRREEAAGSPPRSDPTGPAGSDGWAAGVGVSGGDGACCAPGGGGSRPALQLELAERWMQGEDGDGVDGGTGSGGAPQRGRPRIRPPHGGIRPPRARSGWGDAGPWTAAMGVEWGLTAAESALPTAAGDDGIGRRRWEESRAWQTTASGWRGIVWRRGRRPVWRREAQPMAAEAGSAREARAVEMEAGLAREARPAVDEATSGRGGAAGGCGAVFGA
ncbi:P0497A05.4 [Oryza sativa Japonica Group]|uniref:p0497A05.4 protein n=1 Tax=Oryza sativa subsp. japonica TaxID=39947 RepID=Q8LIW7_ORYSJ|nr:P0497A05.4 [Oryza sativa Japonica Group]